VPDNVGLATPVEVSQTLDLPSATRMDNSLRRRDQRTPDDLEGGQKALEPTFRMFVISRNAALPSVFSPIRANEGTLRGNAESVF
jgi:hypothetical protein